MFETIHDSLHWAGQCLDHDYFKCSLFENLRKKIKEIPVFLSFVKLPLWVQGHWWIKKLSQVDLHFMFTGLNYSYPSCHLWSAILLQQREMEGTHGWFHSESCPVVESGGLWSAFHKRHPVGFAHSHDECHAASLYSQGQQTHSRSPCVEEFINISCFSHARGHFN